MTVLYILHVRLICFVKFPRVLQLAAGEIFKYLYSCRMEHTFF